MEISLRYIYLKLEAIFPFFLALIYLGGDISAKTKEISIKDHVSILTGICIAIFYGYKLISEIGKKDAINDLVRRVEILESQLPHDDKQTPS